MNTLSDIRSMEVWQHTLAESLATGLFVFVGAGSVLASGIVTGGYIDAARLVAIALAHGFAITLLVFATAHVSGGHLNPAVTFAAVLTGKISAVKGAMFVLGQLVGAVLAALLLMYVIPDVSQENFGSHQLGSGVSVGMGFTIEFVLTFMLVFVVFAVAMGRNGKVATAPIAIGLTVAVIHLVAVPLTGAGVNPARSFGPAVAAGLWSDHWIYWVAPLLGGGLAALVHEVLFKAKTQMGQAASRS